MEDLKAIQNEVQNKVAREEKKHQQRLTTVQIWLTRVENIDTQFNNLVSISHIHIQKLCLYGLYSKNVCSSYTYGKKIFLLLEDVKKLKSEGNFEVVSEPSLRSQVEERPTQPTFGQEKMLETAWNRLMEDEVGIMGLHGMGGVGKTTLLKKIHNKFAEISGKFDLVIWVVVSQGVQISNLQEDIAQKLHICDERWTNKNESDKAVEIHRVLKGKRFVLMLDDIWDKVDLVTIGVPIPTRENGCKVAFTTRSRQVCGWMGDHEPVQVNCLERDEAWELFKTKIGYNTLKKNPNIVELARKVAEKCRGLPLALSVIGETMSSKTTVQEWEHAIEVLTRSGADFSGMENKILSILKYSYDSLVDEHIKSCFLYCALFPEDSLLDKEWLIGYWICEGFIEEYKDIKRAMNHGYEVIGTLIRANLLTEVGTKLVVMHDVVREMALWIASCFGKHKESFVVQARVGLREIPMVNEWGDVRKMSLMENKIEEITSSSSCSQLTTLFLQNNKLKKLSGKFIQSMQKLVVLDLFGNLSFNEVPEEISELVSLQYLDLSLTSIKNLPIGIQKLKKLTQLNLNATEKLCGLKGISKLTNLRILKLLHSNVHGDEEVLKELKLLEHLQVLTITVSKELGLKQILNDQKLVKCINGLEIHSFQQNPFDVSLLVRMENLCEFWVENSHVSDLSDSDNSTSPCFSNLSIVRVTNCNSIKDLTWVLFAPNLVYLEIVNSEEIYEIISKEKVLHLQGITPFMKLEDLTLKNLPKLESIYKSSLPFPFLLYITAIECPKLRKLPLNALSVSQVEEFSIEMLPRGHESEIQWEDEDTKNRFLPSFDRV